MKVKMTKNLVKELIPQARVSEVLNSINASIESGINENPVITMTDENILDVKEELEKQIGRPAMLPEIYKAWMVACLCSAIPEADDSADDASKMFMQQMRDLYVSLIYDSLKICSVEDYAEDPYFQNIKIPEVSMGNIKLCTEYMEPFELGNYDIQKFDETYIVAIPRICMFAEKVGFPCLKENGRAWMSITLSEINTHKKPIERAKGNVLVLGLGLGYFPYMISRKDSVKSITIVERSQEVIDIFTQYILPQFEHKNKITIVKADALSFLDNLEDGEYKYCYADIWKSPSEYEGWKDYFAVKERTRHFKKTEFDYWVEDVFAMTISHSTFTEIVKNTVRQIDKTLDDKDVYEGQPDFVIHLFNYTKKLNMKDEIKCYRDVAKCISVKSIKNKIQRAKICFMDTEPTTGGKEV